MLFMPPGNILELRHEADTHNNCYFTLASDLDHLYYYMRCRSNEKDPYLANLIINLIDLEEILTKWSEV
jgi:hypothetical protein